MADSQSIHLPKPKLSQLLLRTLEQLEDPKYSTVPKTHWDELRPSILSKYDWFEGGQDRDLKDEKFNYKTDRKSEQNYCQECLTTFKTTAASSTATAATTPKSNSKFSSTKSKAFRVFNRKLQPVWRYCAAAKLLHIDITHDEVKPTKGSKRTTARKSAAADRTSIPAATNDGKDIEIKIHEEHKTKWLSQSFDHLEKCKHHHRHLCLKAQYSVPAFEVLPPLFENCTHSLLYQNSYLLDGIKYNYDASKTQQERVKLYLNYMRFLRSVNKPLKPTDCEIIFGDAKVVMNPRPHWEGSRINWLLELERKQELRKLKALEDKRLLREQRKAIDLARKEAKRVKRAQRKVSAIAELHQDPSNKPIEPKTTDGGAQQNRKLKGFFRRSFGKSAESKKICKIA